MGNKTKSILFYCWLLIVTALLSYLFKCLELYFLERYPEHEFWLQKVLIFVFILLLIPLVIKPLLHMFGVKMKQ